MRQREILCIDDDEQSLQIRKILLESFDFRVTTATNPRDGLRLFRSRSFEAVVLDYQMPNMDGGQVARKLKAMRANIPVLVLSALPWLPPEAPRDCIDAFTTKGEPTSKLVNQLEHLMETAPAASKPGRSMRLAGAVSGVMVEKIRDLLGKTKPPAKPLATARVH